MPVLRQAAHPGFLPPPNDCPLNGLSISPIRNVVAFLSPLSSISIMSPAERLIAPFIIHLDCLRDVADSVEGEWIAAAIFGDSILPGFARMFAICKSNIKCHAI